MMKSALHTAEREKAFFARFLRLFYALTNQGVRNPHVAIRSAVTVVHNRPKINKMRILNLVARGAHNIRKSLGVARGAQKSGARPLFPSVNNHIRHKHPSFFHKVPDLGSLEPKMVRRAAMLLNLHE